MSIVKSGDWPNVRFKEYPKNTVVVTSRTETFDAGGKQTELTLQYSTDEPIIFPTNAPKLREIDTTLELKKPTNSVAFRQMQQYWSVVRVGVGALKDNDVLDYLMPYTQPIMVLIDSNTVPVEGSVVYGQKYVDGRLTMNHCYFLEIHRDVVETEENSAEWTFMPIQLGIDGPINKVRVTVHELLSIYAWAYLDQQSDVVLPRLNYINYCA